MKRTALPLLLFLALLVLLGVGLTRDPRAVPAALLNQSAPPLQAVALHDPQVAVTSQDLQGRVWLLNVWASWCAGCRVEHPLVAELAHRAKVPVVGLNYKDDRRAARDWLARHGDPYAWVAHDPQGLLGIDWGVHATPTTYVIDRHGAIRHRHVGPITPEVLNDTLLPLIRSLDG